MKKSPAPATDLQPQLTKSDYEALSEFRHQLRRFLHFSETATKEAGLTSQQYLLLLHIQGFPGRDWTTVGELAERLQIQPHGAVALVSRCEENGLVQRSKSLTDQRQVAVQLTAKGKRHLERLAALHRAELESLQHVFPLARMTDFNDSK